MPRTFGVNAFRRYLSLKTHKIYTLPIVILMPHSGCNCQCVMCDIWQGNGSATLLTEANVQDLLASLKKLRTRWVVMSGGEALMNPNLFRLCNILRAKGMKVTILSSGLLLTRYARQLVEQSDEVIVSLDGAEAVHNAIRRVPNAFQKLANGVEEIKKLSPEFSISGRCVIQRLNFEDWPNIVDAARRIGLDQISFLPADVSSEAFNRPDLWNETRIEDVRPSKAELPQLKAVIELLITKYAPDFESGFIAESPEKIWRIYSYYAALQNMGDLPPVRCNAPWVSAVVEADGTVRPCFFHPPLGNIAENALAELVNLSAAISFRQGLDMDINPICRKCVCSLNLRPTVKLV